MLKIFWSVSLLLFAISSSGFISLNLNVKPAALFPVILIFLLLVVVKSKRLIILRSREIKIFMLFILYTIFSGLFFYFTAVDFNLTSYLKGLFSILCGFLFYFVFRTMNLNTADIIRSERLILFSISISILIEIFQFLSFHSLPFLYPIFNNINILFVGNELLSEQRFAGLSPEPAWLAGQVILIMLPLTLSRVLCKETYGVVLRYKGVPLITIESIYFIFALLGILIAGSRTGIYGSIFVVFFGLLVYLKNKKFKALSGPVFLIILISLTLLFFAFKNQYNAVTIQAFSKSNSFGEYSQNSFFGPRASLFLSSFDIFRENTIFGIGLNQFGSYYPNYVQPWALSEPEVISWISLENANPKNFILRLLSETGLVGTLLFLYFISLHFKKKSDLRYKVLKGCFFAGIICFFFEGDSFALPNLWFALGFLI